MYNSSNTAEIIKKTAKSKNIQLKDMLIELELNKNTLSNMYKGSMLKGDSLARIADYLGCSVDYLLRRTDNPEIIKLERKCHMLDIETAKTLKENVLKQLNLTSIPGQPGANALAEQFAEIAAQISVLTLLEYEKLQQNQES